MDEGRKASRAMFRPKFPELKEQCVSCPFRLNNDKEFGEIVAKLRKQKGLKKLTRPESVKRAVHQARSVVLNDMEARGDFFCHHTVYDKDLGSMSMKDAKQCPGATLYFKTGERK